MTVFVRGDLQEATTVTALATMNEVFIFICLPCVASKLESEVGSQPASSKKCTTLVSKGNFQAYSKPSQRCF